MKKLALVALTAATVASSQAQLFGPESLTGAAFGGLAGAIIGHNSGRHGGEGAAIGAGAGLILGSLVGHERRLRYDSYSDPYYDPSYRGYYYHRPYVRYVPMYESVTTQVIQPSQPAPQPVSAPEPARVVREAPRNIMTDANRLFGR